MNRRELLISLGVGFAAGSPRASERLFASAVTKTTRLGVCIHSFGIANGAKGAGRAAKPFGDPLNFLEYCHTLGAGGVQVEIGTKDEGYISKLRAKAAAYEMFVEGSADLPRDKTDVERFETNVRTANLAGAKVIRVVMMPGRRYERFSSAAEFRELSQKGFRSLELAEPVAARHRVLLAIENHKDHRIEEKLDVIKRLSSEYVGMCVDTGNSIALLEEPTEVVKAYAPYAFSVHLKDMAVREYEDGFLLSEVPLGEGFLDLANMVRIPRAAQPEVQFSLEMITRDPLRVPCLTEKYWATFGDVPGSELARTMRMVRGNACKQELPRVAGLSVSEQIEREEENVKRCLAYAREHLGL